jgi:hypothetical protein
MTITPSLLLVSNMQYRLSGHSGDALVRVAHSPFALSPSNHFAAMSPAFNSILERTRRSAEARSLMSRYFSF